MIYPDKGSTTKQSPGKPISPMNKGLLIHLVQEGSWIGGIYGLSFLLTRFLPIPLGLLGMGIFAGLFLTGVRKAGNFPVLVPFALAHMAFFFIPPAVAILEVQGITLGDGVKILILLVVSNILVMGVTGMVVQRILKGMES